MDPSLSHMTCRGPRGRQPLRSSPPWEAQQCSQGISHEQLRTEFAQLSLWPLKMMLRTLYQRNLLKPQVPHDALSMHLDRVDASS